jgi:Na+-driven multidrug efflux pump
VYVIAVVGPITYWGAETIAHALAEAPATVAFASFALRTVPLSGLATIPFVLCRPVFDGMQQGAPGAIMASVRYLGLTLPAAWGGARLATCLGYPSFNGVVLGLIAAGLLVSTAFLAWTIRKVRQLG